MEGSTTQRSADPRHMKANFSLATASWYAAGRPCNTEEQNTLCMQRLTAIVQPVLNDSLRPLSIPVDVVTKAVDVWISYEAALTTLRLCDPKIPSVRESMNSLDKIKDRKHPAIDHFRATLSRAHPGRPIVPWISEATQLVWKMAEFRKETEEDFFPYHIEPGTVCTAKIRSRLGLEDGSGLQSLDEYVTCHRFASDMMTPSQVHQSSSMSQHSVVDSSSAVFHNDQHTINPSVLLVNPSQSSQEPKQQTNFTMPEAPDVQAGYQITQFGEDDEEGDHLDVLEAWNRYNPPQ